jgi:hypothetical protein
VKVGRVAHDHHGRGFAHGCGHDAASREEKETRKN